VKTSEETSNIKLSDYEIKNVSDRQWSVKFVVSFIASLISRDCDNSIGALGNFESNLMPGVI